MKKENINFFKRIWLAISDFRLYPFVQGEKLKVAIGYFIGLLLVMAVILGGKFTMQTVDGVATFLSRYDREVPEFVVENGVFKTSQNQIIKIKEDLELVIRADKSYKQLETMLFDEQEADGYSAYLLADGMAFCLKTEEGVVNLGNLVYTKDTNFSKQTMYHFLADFTNSSWNRIGLWGMVTIFIFLALLMIRVWNLLMYMIIIATINLIFGVPLKYKNYLCIAIYISTLPILLEVMAILLVGSLSGTASIISILLAVVYIFYALRALKLDFIIKMGNSKVPQERMEQILKEAQKDLEKQLNEEERKEQDDEISSIREELKQKEDNLIKAQREYQDALKRALERSAAKYEDPLEIKPLKMKEKNKEKNECRAKEEEEKGETKQCTEDKEETTQPKSEEEEDKK